MRISRIGLLVRQTPKRRTGGGCASALAEKNDMPRRGGLDVSPSRIRRRSRVRRAIRPRAFQVLAKALKPRNDIRRPRGISNPGKRAARDAALVITQTTEMMDSNGWPLRRAPSNGAPAVSRGPMLRREEVASSRPWARARRLHARPRAQGDLRRRGASRRPTPDESPRAPP